MLLFILLDEKLFFKGLYISNFHPSSTTLGLISWLGFLYILPTMIHLIKFFMLSIAIFLIYSLLWISHSACCFALVYSYSMFWGVTKGSQTIWGKLKICDNSSDLYYSRVDASKFILRSSVLCLIGNQVKDNGLSSL